MLWNELVEALLQGEELSLDASHEPPVDVQPGREETRAVAPMNALLLQWRQTRCGSSPRELPGSLCFPNTEEA